MGGGEGWGTVGPDNREGESMTSLGGSIFVRNAVKFDYCIREAVESLVPLCDEVVVLDCQSEDDTMDILQELEAKHGNVRVYDGGEWECAPNFERLALLANQAKEFLRTKWHFMLQADEVLHEDSYPRVREALALAGPGNKTWMVKRFNLYPDFDHYVKENSKRKPCNDYPLRLGRRDIPAVGDAEGLFLVGFNPKWRDLIHIFHYGYVRRRDLILDKAIDMQSWFHGPNSQPDPRCVEMKKTTGFFRPEEIIPMSECKPLTMSHPKVALEWVQERRALLSSMRARADKVHIGPITAREGIS